MTARVPLESGEKPDVEYLDVDQGHVVIVGGRQVPFLRMWQTGERVHFAVNGHGLDCDFTDAEQVARIIANALAVGAGYVGWPDNPADQFVVRPFAPIVHMLGEIGGTHEH